MIKTISLILVLCTMLFITANAVSIPANTEWTTTGITVTAGQSIAITPSGTWRSGTWATPVTYSAVGDAGSHTGMTTYPFLCLIGKIGSSIFYIGNGLTFNAPESGTIYLGPNDGMTSDCWADNDGAITATVNGNGSSIPANTEWTTTGVTVTAGQSITITTSGTWRSGTWATPVTYSAAGDAGSHTDMTMRPFLCLIGKAGSTVFYVGNGGTITMPGAGTLYLGPNDGMTSDCWADNDGSLTVTTTPTGVSGENDNTNCLNKSTLFMEAYPNPLTTSMTIRYQLPKSDKVVLQVYNLSGQIIKFLVNRNQAEGTHYVTWDGKDNNNQKVAAGVYIYKLSSGSKTISEKVLIIR